MPWIEKREGWLPGGRQEERRPAVEHTYTVKEVAEIMKVERHTVLKWLMADEDGGAVIAANGWFKLPSGHIRIRKSALARLMVGLN